MKNTRTNKTHNINKKIKIAVIATITTLSLGFIVLTTAIYLQPSHYKGDTFTNAKTSVSTTTSSTSSTSSSSSSLSPSSDNSDTNIYNSYTEYNSAEVENNYSQETNNNSTEVNNNQSEETTNNNTQVSNDPYNLLNTYIDDIHKVVEYYNGYYIVAEPAQVGYGTKYMYIVYNPETGELAPNGSNMIQEQRDWIDNYGNSQQSQSTETGE